MTSTPKAPHENAYATLQAGQTSLVIGCAQGTRPQILYWGASLKHTAPDQLALMTTRQHAFGSADADIQASLINETGSGLAGLSGFVAHRSGKAWASLFTVEEVLHMSDEEVRILCRDAQTDISLTHIIRLDAQSEIATFQTEVRNDGQDALSLDWCAAACLPLDQRTDRLLGFTGRWANEFAIEDIPPFTGAYVRENKSGRTSHDSFPGLIAKTEATTEQAGMAFGFHLGWSGNSRVRADRLSDGRAFVQMGTYFYPGECVLAAGETFQTPVLYAGFSGKGLSDLSVKFHRHLCGTIMADRTAKTPRPVHYNTWEAVYFDHSPEKLFALAEKAAWVGAERFVLDDGWFGSRRNDRAGLGDWQVSEAVYPEGLYPLIEKVTGLGMEFGLWFEPEMVNPDSDLFRSHPDWILKAEGVEPISFRGQYALDLTRPEVSDHLFEAIDKLLTVYDISYIKWDMNRDVHHPGNQDGRAVGATQTYALYALLERLRAAHPGVEIESCASGGGRADYGILQHTDRIWTSDSNDALDRQLIQRGASHFFPLDVMGAHVGPARCHITGRRLSMALRVATAFFGHMGMELNLLEEDASDLETLKTGIALHKAWRELLHRGDFLRLETPAHVNAVGVIASDQRTALFSWANLTGHRDTLPGRAFFAGLDPDLDYRVQIIWPTGTISRTAPSIIEAGDLDGKGVVLPGEALMQTGLQVPLMNPETCLIYALSAE